MRGVARFLTNSYVLFSTINLGKAGNFHTDELIGQPYGLTYEILDNKLHALAPRTLEEVGECFLFNLDWSLTKHQRIQAQPMN